MGLSLLRIVGTSASAGSSSLVYSRASNQIVQPQPAPGSCHAIGSGLYSRPDPHCTPGALNPSVTQATIRWTICRRGWTSTVRPPERITEQEKTASMVAYGDRGLPSRYEYDHFVPLELGGATNDRRNLWPEPGASPNPKDAVERQLNREMREGKMTLAHAQRAIASNWVALGRRKAAPALARPPAPPAVSCTASAQWNSRYTEYDVYANSNQPDQKVIVTAADGKSRTWHTQVWVRRRVLLRGTLRGRRQVKVQVGAATCHATL